MPVRKFRSVEELPPPPLHRRGSRALIEAIAATWSRSAWLAPPRFPPGVYRHRSIEEMNAKTDAWAAENAAILSGRRR